jgi:hypothetical protein
LKIFKSLFSQFHAAIVVFAAMNILLGIALSLSTPYFSKVALIHLIAGVLIIPVPLLLLLAMKKRKLAWQAFAARMFISKKDSKNYLLLTAKITAWLFLLSLVFSALAGIFIKTGLAAELFPDTNFLLLHTKAIYVVPILLIVHILTMGAAYHKKKAADHQ